MFNMLNKVCIDDERITKRTIVEFLGDTDEVELEFYLTTPFASGMKKNFLSK